MRKIELILAVSFVIATQAGAEEAVGLGYIDSLRTSIVDEKAAAAATKQYENQVKRNADAERAAAETVAKLALAEKQKLEDEAAAKENKEMYPVLLCLRQMVEEQRGGNDGLKLVASYAQLLGTAACSAEKSETKTDYKAILESCKRSLEVLAPAPVKSPMAQRLAAVRDLKSPPMATEFLRGLIQPKVTCQNIKVSAAAAVGIGVGAGFGVSKCSSTSGRQWFEVTGSVGMGFSIGVFVTPTWGKTVRYRGDSVREYMLEFSGHQENGWAAVGGPVDAKRKMGDNHSELKGFTVGLGSGVPVEDSGDFDGTAYLDSNLKILPLGSSSQVLGQWLRACFKPGQEYFEDKNWKKGPHSLNGHSTEK
jgi:hypothetical protein